MTLPEYFGIFDRTTSYRDDYRNFEFNEAPKLGHLTYVDYLDKKVVIKPPIQYDLETLTKFRQTFSVPSHLLLRTKEILRTNPHHDLKTMQLQERMMEEKLHVRRTRPRVYLEPQIVLDDVHEDIMYAKDGLAAQIYSSDWKEACQFSVDNSKLIEIPDPATVAVMASLDRKTLLDKEAIDATRFKSETGMAPMDPRFEKYAKEWETLQKKVYYDKSKVFWNTNKHLGLCTLCDPKPENSVVTDEEAILIDGCIKRDVLSLPYTILNAAYMGFKPVTPFGVKYCKKVFKKGDPYVTSLMEHQKVYRK